MRLDGIHALSASVDFRGMDVSIILKFSRDWTLGRGPRSRADCRMHACNCRSEEAAAASQRLLGSIHPPSSCEKQEQAFANLGSHISLFLFLFPPSSSQLLHFLLVFYIILGICHQHSSLHHASNALHFGTSEYGHSLALLSSINPPAF